MCFFCSFLCFFLPSISSILLFFSNLLSVPCSAFPLYVYSLYFLISRIAFFSNLLSFLCSFPILSASPICSIAFQSVLFVLFFIFFEASMYYFFAISFALSSVFFILFLFGKDPMTLPVFFSLSSFPLFSFCSFLCYLFALVSIISLFLFSPLFISTSFLNILTLSFFIYFYFLFLFFLIINFEVLYFVCIDLQLLPTDYGYYLFYVYCFCCLRL